jgi:hypothetical protein
MNYAVARMPQIKLSERTYKRLLARVESFEDTPEDVIVRLLTVAGRKDQPERMAAPRSARKSTLPRPILPERDYWPIILAILEQAGGTAQVADVIDEVGQRLDPHLKPADFQRLRTGEIRWQNRARFARLRMKKLGLVSDSSARGIWEITEAGRDYLEQIRALGAVGDRRRD